MKKIFTLLVVAVCFGFNVNAKTADLRVVTTLKAQDTILYNNTGAYGKIVYTLFINDGPDPLLASDSLFWLSAYNGSVYLTMPPAGLPANDTLYAADTVALLPSEIPTTNPFTYCDSIWAKTNTGALVIDPTMSNNKTCKTVLFLHATGVKNVAANSSSLSIYPNPANNNLTVEYLFANNEAATVTVSDLLGKAVIRQDLGKNLSGRQKQSVDVSSLSNGVYMVELSTTSGRAMTKLVIQK